MSTPLPIGTPCNVAYRIPGTNYVTGSSVTVAAVHNNGTKRRPIWRYRIEGKHGSAWVDADALDSQLDPFSDWNRVPELQVEA